MSLDVYLYPPNRPETRQQKAVKLLLENEFDKEAWYLDCRSDPDYIGAVFDANITHNLNRMAEAAGIYKACWRPDEIGITHAKQLIEPLTEGLKQLRANPAKFERYNAENGWGIYDDFVPWVERYLRACQANPEATVSVSR